MQPLSFFSFIHFNTTTDVVNFIQTGNVNLGRGNYPPQFFRNSLYLNFTFFYGDKILVKFDLKKNILTYDVLNIHSLG